MQASQRTWRGFVTAPPQSGQLHSSRTVGSAAGRCRGVLRVALLLASILRAFTTACAALVREDVSGVAAWYLPSIARPRM